MRRYFGIPLLLFAIQILLYGCSPSIPLWRKDAVTILEKVRQEDGQRLLPAEFGSVEELIVKGDLLVRNEEIEAADRLFLLAWSKGNVLERNLALEKHRIEEEKRRKIEAVKIEQEKKEAAAEEARLLREKAEADRAALEAAEARKAAEKAEKSRLQRERQLPLYHTVKRGETLPFIASQPEVYNDRNLWPLLYRANRDQISNPRHIWPGQVLRIPRNSSREEIAEAKRYALERPLH